MVRVVPLGFGISFFGAPVDYSGSCKAYKGAISGKLFRSATLRARVEGMYTADPSCFLGFGIPSLGVVWVMCRYTIVSKLGFRVE